MTTYAIPVLAADAVESHAGVDVHDASHGLMLPSRRRTPTAP